MIHKDRRGPTREKPKAPTDPRNPRDLSANYSSAIENDPSTSFVVLKAFIQRTVSLVSKPGPKSWLSTKIACC